VNEHLMRALIYAALFFETSSEDECEPDLAVKQLEAIAAELQRMTTSEQDECRRFAYDLAAAHPIPAVRDEIRTLIDGLLPAPGT
jgi:hypothetical protein